jgi:hypothetical protein
MASGPYAGKASTFYMPTPGGTPTLVSGAPMTQVGTSLKYYITTRTNAWWDPNSPVVVLDGVTPVTGCKIVHAGGYVTLPATPVGTVTVNVYTLPLEKLGGGFGWNTSKKAGTVETTVFPAIAGSVTDKTHIGTGITEWTASVKEHFWYAKASYVDPIAVPNASLTWTWKGSGSFGNDEAIVYSAGAVEEVARVANVTTVTYVTGGATTTAAMVKAHVEADATLNALWELSYTSGNGTGYVGAVSHVHCTGGRDSLQNLSKVATNVLAIFYLEVANAATSWRQEGVGIITNFNLDEGLESLVDTALDFQGTGPFEVHNS